MSYSPAYGVPAIAYLVCVDTHWYLASFEAKQNEPAFQKQDNGHHAHPYLLSS